MSEKRFTYGETIDYNFFDVFEEKKYVGMIQRDSTKIVDLLNEQQATINKLKSDIEETEISIKLFEDDVNRLSKENEQLRQSVNYWQKKYEQGTETLEIGEQQATIRRLQDLCGESDSENAKLRIENKKLKEMNEQLREINKDIGDDLYNCRLNKNIIREKLKLWQDVHKEYNIYNIKDFEESFKLDAKINKEKDEKIKELQAKVLNLELKNEELDRK